MLEQSTKYKEEREKTVFLLLFKLLPVSVSNTTIQPETMCVIITHTRVTPLAMPGCKKHSQLAFVAEVVAFEFVSPKLFNKKYAKTLFRKARVLLEVGSIFIVL